MLFLNLSMELHINRESLVPGALTDGDHAVLLVVDDAASLLVHRVRTGYHCCEVTVFIHSAEEASVLVVYVTPMGPGTRK